MLRGRALDMQHDAGLIRILSSVGKEFIRFINDLFSLRVDDARLDGQILKFSAVGSHVKYLRVKVVENC